MEFIFLNFILDAFALKVGVELKSIRRALHKIENTQPCSKHTLWNQDLPVIAWVKLRHYFAALTIRYLLMLTASVVTRKCQVDAPIIPV
jgi:hypothetical protein